MEEITKEKLAAVGETKLYKVEPGNYLIYYGHSGETKAFDDPEIELSSIPETPQFWPKLWITAALFMQAAVLLPEIRWALKSQEEKVERAMQYGDSLQYVINSGALSA